MPQLADADEVLPRVHRRPDVRYPVLVPNMRGLERAERAGADAVAVFTAASDEFTERNIGMSIAESLAAFEPVLDRAIELGWWRRGYVSTAFGCPYSGDVEPARVVQVCSALLELGCDEISVGDTIGVAEPDDVRRVCDELLAHVPVDRLALHLHDTRGRALDNVQAGLERGVSIYDSSAGGTGGCPFAPGAPGNLATESLCAMLDRDGHRARRRRDQGRGRRTRPASRDDAVVADQPSISASASISTFHAGSSRAGDDHHRARRAHVAEDLAVCAPHVLPVVDVDEEDAGAHDVVRPWRRLPRAPTR